MASKVAGDEETMAAGTRVGTDDHAADRRVTSGATTDAAIPPACVGVALTAPAAWL